MIAKLKEKLYRFCTRPTINHCEVGRNVMMARFVSLTNSQLHDYCNITDYCRIRNSSIGKRTSIGTNTRIMDAKIGAYCSISWNCSIGAADHPIDRLSGHAFAFQPRFGIVDRSMEIAGNEPTKETIVGNDVWIGCNAIVRSGVTIGNGAVIGAGSIVLEDVPDYAVVVGAPARIIKYRFPEEERTALADLPWWDLPDETLKKHYKLFQHKLQTKDIEELQTLFKK